MPNETPKLDELSHKVLTDDLFFYQSTVESEQRDKLFVECLLEIRSLIKVARIGATNVPREGT